MPKHFLNNYKLLWKNQENDILGHQNDKKSIGKCHEEVKFCFYF